MSKVIRKYQLSVLYENPLLPDGIKEEATTTYSGGLKRNTRGVLKGLTEQEEEIMLPPIIGVSYNDNAFRQRADGYWADFGVSVPHNGLELDAGYTLQGDRKIPNNFEHYTLANMMLNDDNVCTNPKESFGYKFLLVDIAAKEQEAQDLFSKTKAANAHLAKMLADESKEQDTIIRNILIFHREKLVLSLNDIDTMDRLKLEMALTKFAQDAPDKFMKVSQNESLEYRAFIKRLEEAGIIDILGEIYFDKNEKLGTQSQFANTLKGDNELYVKYQSQLLEMNK